MGQAAARPYRLRFLRKRLAAPRRQGAPRFASCARARCSMPSSSRSARSSVRAADPLVHRPSTSSATATPLRPPVERRHPQTPHGQDHEPHRRGDDGQHRRARPAGRRGARGRRTGRRRRRDESRSADEIRSVRVLSPSRNRRRPTLRCPCTVTVSDPRASRRRTAPSSSPGAKRPHSRAKNASLTAAMCCSCSAASS